MAELPVEHKVRCHNEARLPVDFYSLKGNHPGFVIPNGVLCREESAVAGVELAAGSKQIPLLQGRNDNTCARSE
jgi:hypothetical protein